jgi:hypothetical protein
VADTSTDSVLDIAIEQLSARVLTFLAVFVTDFFFFLGEIGGIPCDADLDLPVGGKGSGVSWPRE